MNSHALKPHLILTAGDPAGIGPEIALVAARTLVDTECAEVTLVGPSAVFSRIMHLRQWSPEYLAGISIEAIEHMGALPAFGAPSALGGVLSREALSRAVSLMHTGRYAALVTAPIAKTSWRLAGYQEPGQTEYLQQLTGAKEVRMLLSAHRLHVVLHTIHIPLKEVFAYLTIQDLYASMQCACMQMAKILGVSRPHLAVCGINPHAGENGHLGHEETSIVQPAIAYAQQQGLNVSGPYAPDSVFYDAAQGAFDAVLALYHDQGAIAVKTYDRDAGVNVTLGLPFLRTSPDHGTAFDKAHLGGMSAKSMLSACRFALNHATGSHKS